MPFSENDVMYITLSCEQIKRSTSPENFDALGPVLRQLLSGTITDEPVNMSIDCNTALVWYNLAVVGARLVNSLRRDKLAPFEDWTDQVVDDDWPGQLGEFNR
jgi:hypothetical protein